MADMRTAILRAAQAADRLHKEFDTKTYTDGEEGRINVFGMMAQRDLPVMFRPLDKLLGAYLDEGPTRAYHHHAAATPRPAVHGRT